MIPPSSTSMQSQKPEFGIVLMPFQCLSCWLLLAGVMLLGSGCAGIPFKNPLPVAEDVHAKKEKRREEIVKEYEEKRSQALYQAAITRLHQGDDAGCRQAVQQLLQLAPQHAAGRLLKAEDHLMRYELAEAQHEIQQVLKDSPEHPQALHAMGLVKEALGESEAAAEFFGRAAELAPDDQIVAMDYESSMDPDYSSPDIQPESNSQAALELENTNTKQKQIDTNSVKLVALRASDNPRTQTMLRKALLAIPARETEVAITQIQQAMELEPENFRIPQLFALEAIKTNHSEVACPILKASVTHFPQSAELYRLYGLALYRDQQYQASEQALREAVSLDNRDALAYFLLGQVLSRVGQTDQSQHFLTEAARLDPSLSAQTLTR